MNKKITGSAKGARRRGAPQAPLRMAAVGMEAEFAIVVDGKAARPEDVFGDPRAFLPEPVVHREGTSYHLPNGGAVYFDTGVIEIMTPVIEIERGCAARAGRSLWEGILYIRRALDDWERRTGRSVRLTGFSTHYNISFELSPAEQGADRTVHRLAKLLAYLLPVPVMLLATNKRSTGVGVRPREGRLEVTVDFTPSASLMIATGTLITGIVRAVMAWPSYRLAMLDRLGLPVIQPFKPVPHTSRKGWLARHDCYSHNPFTGSPNEARWDVRPPFFEKRGMEPRPLSLRDISRAIFRYFYPALRRVADPFTLRLLRSVLHGQTPTLLDLDDRPPEYEDVGRLCFWDNLFTEEQLSRSRYERILIRAISGKRLLMAGDRFTPIGMRGWSEVVFRRDRDGTRHLFAIDDLLQHLDDWERPRPVRRRKRRV